MYEKNADTYPSALMHVSNCHKTQTMCEKALILWFLVCAPDCYETQEIYE